MLDPDALGLKVLWCMHHYLYPTARHMMKNEAGRKSLVRYTVQDSQNTFLYLGATMQALENHLDKFKSRKENIQPFILAIGDLQSKVDQFFVYVDNSYIECTIFFKSVDICFKVLHIFNLKYPKACEPFWTFIANYLFEIFADSKKHSKVSTLVDDLNKN